MPARWFVPIRGLDPSRVRAHHLHAAITRWFDSNAAEHGANVKPYAVSPLVDDPTGRRAVGVEIATLTHEATGLLDAATVPGSTLRLGNQSRPVGRPQLMHQASWDELASTAPAEVWVLEFVTPATFRSGNRTSPLPQPRTLVSGLLSAWQRWCDIELPGGREAVESTWVSDVLLHSEVLHMPVIGKDKAVREIVASGVLGRIALRCDPLPGAAALGALASLAAYSGVGSMTLRGLGVTRVTARRGASDSSGMPGEMRAVDVGAAG